jgi:hypothetical protein
MIDAQTNVPTVNTFHAPFTVLLNNKNKNGMVKKFDYSKLREIVQLNSLFSNGSILSEK